MDQQQPPATTNTSAVTPAAQPQTASSLREQVQSQVVSLITKGLEEGTISEERARTIAKLILEKLPEGLTQQELMQIIPKLDDEFHELAEVVLPIMGEYEDKLRKAVETKVLALVRARKFVEALELTRKGIAASSELT